MFQLLGPDGRVVLTWDAHEAREVGHVLQDAGYRNGRVVDRGFHGDGMALWRAADEELGGADG
jgi:hypothetical protein